MIVATPKNAQLDRPASDSPCRSSAQFDEAVLGVEHPLPHDRSRSAPASPRQTISDAATSSRMRFDPRAVEQQADEHAEHQSSAPTLTKQKTQRAPQHGPEVRRRSSSRRKLASPTQRRRLPRTPAPTRTPGTDMREQARERDTRASLPSTSDRTAGPARRAAPTVRRRGPPWRPAVGGDAHVVARRGARRARWSSSQSSTLPYVPMCCQVGRRGASPSR